MQILVLTFGVHWSLVIQYSYIPVTKTIGLIAVVMPAIIEEKRRALKSVITDGVEDLTRL